MSCSHGASPHGVRRPPQRFDDLFAAPVRRNRSTDLTALDEVALKLVLHVLEPGRYDAVNDCHASQVSGEPGVVEGDVPCTHNLHMSYELTLAFDQRHSDMGVDAGTDAGADAGS